MNRSYAPRLERTPSPASETQEPPAEMPPVEAVTDIPLSPEVAEAVRQEQEVRYEDVELLGRRYSVQRVIHESSVQAVQKAREGIAASYRNALDRPGRMARRVAHSLAESNVARKQAKYDEVAHLGDNSFLKRRRLTRLQKAEHRRDQTKVRLDERTTRMEARTKTVEDNAETRRLEYIAGLKARREQALGRKTVRHELRQQGAGWLESRALTKEIVETMPKEHLARVGELATVAHASQNFARRAERSEQKTVKQELNVTSRIATNEQRMKQYSQEAREAHRVVAEIRSTHLPAAEQRVTELQNELAELADDDPERENVAVKLQEAEEHVKLYTQRELPFWISSAQKNEQYVVVLGQQQQQLKQQLETHKESTAAASETADQKRTTATRHAEAASTEAQRIINGE